MLVQSSFSFVFHLFPGVMLLGICLGQMARSANSKSKSGQVTGNKVLLSLAAAGCCLLLIPFGWKGTRITYSLWPVFFSKDAVASLESRIEKISLAITQWPQTELHQERAISYLALANSETVPAMVIQAKEAAIKDYRQATRLHPFDPSFLINGANLLSDLERDKEAEMDYAKAIQLQGGMEPAFRGNLSSSIHYLKKGIRQFTNGNLPEALRSLEIASDQIESACKEMQWILNDMVETRVAIHESLGAAREASGDLKGAMESYEFAAALRGGGRANYRVGSLYGKLASQAWTARRPSEALGYFNQARKRIAIPQNLPQGVTPSQRVEYLAYLDQTIAFLKSAKVTPPPDKLEN
jgi:tetratricopeptide (TPR) repeat protein